MVFKPKSLPLLPLPAESVLLPGSVLRIGVSRRDTAALLARIYRRSEGNIDTPAVVGCVPLKQPTEPRNKDDAVNVGDVYEYGALARVIRLERRVGDGFMVIVEGISRFRIENVHQTKPFMEALVYHYREDPIEPSNIAVHGLFAQLKSISKELLSLLKNLQIPALVLRRLEAFVNKSEVDDASNLCDFMMATIECTYEEKLDILSAHDLGIRMQKSLELLNRQLNVLKISQKINTSVDSKLSRKQREFYLRQQMNAIREELGEKDSGGGEEDEMADLARKLESARLSPEADKVAQRELKRLKRMQPSQAEYQVCRTYLETLAEIPWSVTSTEVLDRDMLARAKKQMDDDHYGLEKIKRRLTEYLAVLRLKRDTAIEQIGESMSEENVERRRQIEKGPILLLVGPPGVGKTSLAKSVAHAMGRKLHRISLGGIRDEAEIRGHRRTYVGAMPGIIVQGLRKVGVANPVFLLDEIDKISGNNFHGDPSAAMLEVLDPEQNYAFNDHYVNVPVDLSKVLFIATANTLETIPAPLLDRMETIELSGYTFMEKQRIASQFLIPKQIKSNGLLPDKVVITDDVVMKIATSYTREAGVRNLERELASVCRAKAVEWAEMKDGGKEGNYNPVVAMEDIDRILGIEKFTEELAERDARPGVVTGLAYMGTGNGGIMFIEVSEMPGRGMLQLTGKLGEVIKESAQLALSWVKSHAYQLHLVDGPNENIVKDRDIHIHLPSGATPKEGPSAGVAIALALVSMLSQQAVPASLALTGEMSLRGNVLPVGGIKEKVLAAHRAGVKTILLPERNRKDVVGDIPKDVREQIHFVYANSMWQVLRAVWPSTSTFMESRL